MASTFRVAEADLQRDMPAIAGIISQAFAEGGYVDEIQREYIGNCNYDPRVTRLVWEGERLVHHWGVWGYEMRVAAPQGEPHPAATLRVAGIGAVTTDENYRKQGVMEIAARESFHAMEREGYDLSILRGRHYVKFGYTRAWNYITYRLKGAEIPTRAPLAYRALVDADFEALTALYNQAYAGFSGSAVRPTYRGFKSEGPEPSYYGWFGAEGSLEGFVRAMPDEERKHLLCLEAAGDPAQCLAVLGELFRHGMPPAEGDSSPERKPYETISFFTLPHQHPVLQVVRQGACLVEAQYFSNTGWRVRLVNLRSALEKLRPLLEMRLRNSHLAGWHGSLLLEAGGLVPPASLELHSGQVIVTPPVESPHHLLGGAALARLLIGSDEPNEVMRQEGMTCRGAAARLAEVLFPNLYPMLSHWDEF